MSTQDGPPYETANLHFLHWQDEYSLEKPFEIVTKISKNAPDQRRTNLVLGPVRQQQQITDIRGHQDDYTLDKHGFSFRKRPFNFDGFEQKERILEEYLPWAQQTLEQELDDVGKVFIFDWRLRRSDYVPKEMDLEELHQFLPPAAACHVDQSPWEMLRRCHKFLGSETEVLLSNRVRIINLWRPLHHTVKDRPLALCDGRTVEDQDLVTTDYVRHDFVQETLYLKHTQRQKWYYLSHQTPDDILLLKIFDSGKEVEAKYCPHTSFTHTKIPADATPRQSIEVRAFVFSHQ